MLRFWCVCSLFLVAGIAGCGEDFRKEVAPVTGTVTCDGAPVTEGYVYFTPKLQPGADPKTSGKGASAYIQPDGTYTLTTYEEGDGAIMGEHVVHIERLAPEDDESPEGIAYDRDPNLCGDRLLEVTVEDKNNVIDLDPGKD